MRKTIVETEISKELILDAAEIEFGKYGYAGAKIDNIAKRTKMTKGAIFWHYHNKLELYKIVLQKIIKRMRKITKEVFSTNEPVMEQCRNVISKARKDKSFEILSQLGKLDREKKISKIAIAGIKNEASEILKDLFEIIERAKKEGKIKAESNTIDILITMMIFISGFSQVNLFSNMLNINKELDCEAAIKILFKGLAYYQRAKM